MAEIWLTISRMEIVNRESWKERSLEAINHTQKKRIIGPKKLGADGHCLVANTSYLAGVTFDWLDEGF